jgi:hypothetical protein
MFAIIGQFIDGHIEPIVKKYILSDIPPSVIWAFKGLVPNIIFVFLEILWELG